MKRQLINFISVVFALSAPFAVSAQFHYDNGTLSIGTPTDPTPNFISGENIAIGKNVTYLHPEGEVIVDKDVILELRAKKVELSPGIKVDGALELLIQ